MRITLIHIIGILLTVGLLVAISIVTSRRVRDVRSFVNGGRAGSLMVCGIIMATLVGGQSTIGTAQLAFCHGLSAWWFTIGAAMGALLLALVYVVPLRRSGCLTLMEIVAHEYGHRVEGVGSVLCLMGIFISIVSQVLSSSAMMSSLFDMPVVWAAATAALLIALFVVLGGIKSTGAGGIVKVVLLYVSSVVAAIVVWRMAGGLHNISADIQSLVTTGEMGNIIGVSSPEEIHQRYGNLIARGPLKDIGSGISMMLGVVATQSYAQGVWAARNHRKARQGVLLAALLVPVIGAACTLVGLYMRGHYVTTDEFNALTAAGGALPEGIRIIRNSAEVFPQFVLDCCPDWMGGIVLGTLFVTVLGGGSGLVLGASTIMVRDVMCNLPWRRSRQVADTRTDYRISIIALVVMAFVASLLSGRTLINDLGFLSLGLRATAILLPLTTALFMPHRFTRHTMMVCMIEGTLTMIVAFMLNLPADPIFWGIGGEMLVMLIARLAHHGVRN